MYTQTHTLARTHIFSHSLALALTKKTDTHTLTQPHYTPVSLSWCLVGLCSAPAREVKCRRAGPDCTVGGEGDGWLGVVAVVVVVVWGAREREGGREGGRVGGYLMRNSCPRMEGSGWGVLEGRVERPPLCNSAVLKARAVLEAWGCWGK